MTATGPAGPRGEARPARPARSNSPGPSLHHARSAAPLPARRRHGTAVRVLASGGTADAPRARHRERPATHARGDLGAGDALDHGRARDRRR